ncbi:MAG TPA: hypothetical protein ENJ87_13025 [Gammaproteobacteria bacterium]|nr:hypothetical protein [Gammaproteobacteria bacterium]
MNDASRRRVGIVQSLVLEFERHRLPRLLRLKDKVDRGEAINDVDFEFLCNEVKDASLTMHLIVSYPELQDFCLEMAHLCKEICDEAVENEKKRSSLAT